MSAGHLQRRNREPDIGEMGRARRARMLRLSTLEVERLVGSERAP
jgi:hypothetical protein